MRGDNRGERDKAGQGRRRSREEKSGEGRREGARGSERGEGRWVNRSADWGF